MTLHTAKGLEFPVVFVTGWEDGMFPHMRALGDPVELSEERRLAYVGITRARQRLYLSRAKVRSSWGQPMLNPESRFLREIPEDLIDWRRTDPGPGPGQSFSAPVTGRFGPPRRRVWASGPCWCWRKAIGSTTTNTVSDASKRYPVSGNRRCH